MSTSLSKLVDSLSEGLHINRCPDCKSCLDYMTTKDEKLILRCFSCKKNYEKDVNKELIKRFANTYNFCDNNLNKFILLLRKAMICHAIHRHAKANNKYMKNYDKNKESPYIEYVDARNLNGCAMSQKLSINGFKWIKNVTEIYEKFIKNYNEDSDKGYILEVDVKYPRKVHGLHRDLPFLPKRIKIDKCKKLVCNLRNKKKYIVHIRSLKQALNHGLKLKKVHRIIEFNKESWLKPYIDMNTELRKTAKNDFEKDFFKLMNNGVFGKTMENVRKHRDIKLVTTDKKRSKLVSKLNYHTINYISENLSIIEMKRTKVKMNKPIYLGLSILEISKILMHEFWYDYMEPKYGYNVKLCYMDTDSFIMNIKTFFTLNIFTRILLMILKKDLMHQIMKLIGHYS